MEREPVSAALDQRWWSALDDARISDVAAELGLTVTPARGAHGGTLAPCPACGGAKRHTKNHDRRGAVGIRRDQRGAFCFQCEQGFTAFVLVCWVIGGERWRHLSDVARDRVREWVARYTGGAVERPKPLPLPEPEPLSYPPDVEGMWSRCVPVTEVSRVGEWLARSRKIDPAVVATMDVARAAVGILPEWCKLGRHSWHVTGHVLVIPLYDARGQLRSVLGRAVVPAERKSIAPRGYARAGLVMADRLGRELLATGRVPADCDGRVIVVEGEPDFLVAATQTQLEGDRLPAVIGIVQGAWVPDVAARIPSGTTVVVATHADPAGEKYARRINDSLAKRARSGALCLERWRP